MWGRRGPRTSARRMTLEPYWRRFSSRLWKEQHLLRITQTRVRLCQLRAQVARLRIRLQRSWGYRAEKFVRRNSIAVAAAAAVFVTLVVGIVMTIRAEARARKQFDEVRRLAHTVLFDYHDAIESLPGSTPVRQKLVKDALSYLDGLSQQRQDEGWSERSPWPM